MKFKRNICIVLVLLVCVKFTSAGKFCLCFKKDFLSLLEVQKNRYLMESSKERIDCEMKKSKDFNEYLIQAMCYYGIPQNLGEVYALGEKAYIYIQAQGKAVAFSQSYCNEISTTLEKFLKKTFAEYRDKIFHYEISPTTKNEYEECKRFIEFFKDYEDKPLEKLGNIFKEKANNICSIQ